MTHDAAAGPLSARPLRRAAGPGILESVGWTLGYLIMQFLAAAGLVVLLVVFAFEGWPGGLEVVLDVLDQMQEADVAWMSVCLTGGATLGALFFIVPAACWRLRPSPRNALGTDLPDGRQLVLLAGVVLPLAILSDEVYRAASLWWEAARVQLAQFWPAIEEFGSQDTMSLVQDQAAVTAYPLLLVIVGVGPAIGEELVFRGVIGRGLVNRLGVVWGVLLTSLLFALAHGTPAHAVATLPLAIVLHLTYLATRTIWAPILVHFLNNALSVTMLKYGLGQNVEPSAFLLVSAALYVMAMGIMLWRTRDGRSLASSVPTPPHVPLLLAGDRGGIVPVVSPRWLTLLATTGVLSFTWTFVAAAMAGS